MEPTPYKQRQVRRGRRNAFFWLWLLPLVLGILWLAAVSYKLLVPRSAPRDESSEAVFESQRLIREYLGPRIQTRFSGRDWTKVTRNGDRYIVTGWVDAERRDGRASAVYEFTCTVFRNLDGAWYNWDLNLTPQ